MPLTVKDMMEAARAAVPTVNTAEAQALIDKGALVVDIRDSSEIAASGKVPGAIAVQRGLLEFKADPSHPLLRLRRPRRARRQDTEGHGLH